MEMNLNHLSRYKEILQLVWKYGRSDLVQQMAIDQDLGNGSASSPAAARALPSSSPTISRPWAPPS